MLIECKGRADTQTLDDYPTDTVGKTPVLILNGPDKNQAAIAP
jgi:hypothetical protein